MYLKLHSLHTLCNTEDILCASPDVVIAFSIFQRLPLLFAVEWVLCLVGMSLRGWLTEIHADRLVLAYLALGSGTFTLCIYLLYLQASHLLCQWPATPECCSS